MGHFTYMLRCSDNSIYSGYTTDLSRRLAMHNAGTASRCTRSRLPVRMVFFEEYPTKQEAMQREAALKKLKHDDKERLIAEFCGILPGPLIMTERLAIRPLSDEEMEELRDGCDDEILAQAYGEMLSGCTDFPEHRLWYTAWKMFLRGDEAETSIGDLCFKGPAVKGMVEIGYGISKEYEGRGLMTEAARALIGWALSQKGVNTIEAETDSDNLASQRILDKLSFQRCGTGEEGPRYRLTIRHQPFNIIHEL